MMVQFAVTQPLCQCFTAPKGARWSDSPEGDVCVFGASPLDRRDIHIVTLVNNG